MSRETGLLIVLGVAFVVLVLMGIGWWRRSRRDAGLTAPLGSIDLPAAMLVTDGLYVATTAHDQPLNRLAVRGLVYRSRCTVAVAPEGVLIAIVGSADVLIPASAITAVDRATLAIDRVVERDGLVRLSWSIDATTIVDTYLRVPALDPQQLVDAITAIIPAVTGSNV